MKKEYDEDEEDSMTGLSYVLFGLSLPFIFILMFFLVESIIKWMSVAI
mgnify:CR=1 FL=1